MTAVQQGLFGREAAAIDERFESVRRIELYGGAWIEYQQGWLRGHEQVFATLREESAWRQQRRVMYERLVDVPRLEAHLPDDGPGHPVIERMQTALARRFGTVFDTVSLALYRDGRDSVAWHGDQVARDMPNSVMATVSVGAPRRFLLRPKQGGGSIALSLGWGDLVVMGGTCQRTWEHCVPKVAHAAPRLTIMLRPLWRR